MPSLETRLLKLTDPPMAGEDVLIAQMRLIRRGFPCTANGIFDQATATAVTKFQQASSLKNTGELNESTYELLFGGSK